VFQKAWAVVNEAVGASKPSVSGSPNGIIRFGSFEVDTRAGELRRGGIKVKLSGQPFEVLVALLEKPGRVITREELHEKLWSQDTFVDFEHGLNKAINKVRDALGDDAGNPRFVETLPRRGYRFLAPVIQRAPEISVTETSAQAKEPALAVAPVQSKARAPVTSPGTIAVSISEPPVTRRPPRSLRLVASALAGLLAGALLLGVVLGLNLANSRDWLRRRSNPQVRSLAVLPLQNLSGDPTQEYFADGMTDELITELAELGSVRVISRTSVMQYKGAQKPLRQIANELGVDAILEGSVLRSGQHVRVTAQLIDAATDQHLWARTYDRELGDVLLLESDMAGAIAQEIRAEINGNARPLAAQVSRVDPEEQDLYFRGRYHLSKGSEDEINKGIEYFRRAIEHSPRDARNYAALADSYLALSDYYLSPAATLELGKQAAMKALQLDDNLAETHVSLGAIRFLYDWDWPQAEKEFTQAVKLNPNSSDAHLWRGVFLAQMGHSDEGISEIKLAESLDPLSLAVRVNAGWVYYLARRDEQAVQEWRKILDIDPHFTVTHSSIWIAYVKQAEMGTVLSPLSSGDADALQLAAITGRQAVSGNRAEAERLLSRLDSISKRHYVCPYEMATAHAVLGNKDKALDWLSKGLKERSACMADMKVDPRLDSLRADARFNTFLKQVGFQP
jgi:TolB-like protein/DNA-binding winged helix-turn-helix (wHTH) protein/Tfp pilus assembly protein PilF